ncbi:ribonucleotide-diphosphate reductase subunit beta [Verrucomicrobiaceae bacterium 5K15]|uniref:ribonucleoside-diphosphate reductase n=1 Tax=Oceaniferula flava TaxID=2800421 RepID=A0AAE2SD22_9BACT|nr:ribonucleotide-diphosphate reductase subunit beta [Oceaniferula flavus]MBK1855638.1 ribonucleotide-diphosphate reductase subunit beta [Oceaniferula flavus]MBM1136944.1 ribonucleotide-diphosphate reductase subunit beta [Oceaniferula flavus]
MADTITITLGERTFNLDREKAEEAYAAKKVLNGRNSMFFNILPLKYNWAYALYKEMKNSHWEPAEVAMNTDAAQWGNLGASCQMLYKTALGAFARSQELFQSHGIYTVRDLVTAPELKLVFGRFVHEENTRSDVLVHLHGSLRINPMECAELADIPAINAKKDFVTSKLSPLNRNTDTTTTANKQAVARNIFLINQCMEGTQCFALWASLFSLSAQNKTPGTGKVFNKLIGDITFRLSLFDQLLQEMVGENPDIWTDSFKAELTEYMVTAVRLEKDLIAALPVADAGLDPAALGTYIEFLADERLGACQLPRQFHHASSPFPWLDEQLHLASKHAAAVASSTLDTSFDDDDL